MGFVKIDPQMAMAGVIQPSFQAGCRALGLLEDDAHWNSTLEETSNSESPNKIQSLGNIVGDLITLTERIYPNIHQVGVDCSSWLKERAILTPINDSANNINNFLLNKLSTKHAKYESVDLVMEAEDTIHYPVEFFNTLNPPGLPPIMLLLNLNPPKLCNETKLQEKNLHKNIIQATILTGKYEGEIVFISIIPLIPSDYHLEFKRIEYPITVCYVMTINKTQEYKK
ncbi:ATP-dependent DNA helicase [Trichonephila clavipes]|nr:ATP-dependent DNA helicase [Trichonephila clavipes]